jgi:prepilin-type N-terminal cleavage/methylation domain-containing protein
MSTRRKAFSLTELVIVIALTLVLFAVATLVFRQSNQGGGPSGPSARTLTICNLKQIALALHCLNDVYKKLPPAWGSFANSPAEQASIHYHILPFIEEENL